MLLAIIPGLSQVYLDRVLVGAVFFAAFLTALNCVFLAGNLQSATNTYTMARISILSLVIIWVGSVWHAYALSYGTDRSGLARDRGQLLRTALVDYLRNDLDAAAIKLERAIELDVDWQDPDPLFHLGVLMLRLAEERALEQDTEGSRTARRRSQWAFRTCLSRDKFHKWRREIRRETTRMRPLLQSSGRGTSERLDPADTMMAAFPELGESTSIPRAILGPDSSRYARITPRPFSRKTLKERLEASGIEEDTVAAEPPGAPGQTESPPEELEASGSPDALEAGSEESAEESTEESTEPRGADENENENENVGEGEGDLAATHPAQRLLPGEDGDFSSATEAEEEPVGLAVTPEGGMPATRLDVRPLDIIGDLLPATRHASRGEKGALAEEEIYPDTRRETPRLQIPDTRPTERGPLDAPETCMPPTRHISRRIIGALGRASLRKEAAEAGGSASEAGSGDAAGEQGEGEPAEDSPQGSDPEPGSDPDPDEGQEPDSGSDSGEDSEHVSPPEGELPTSILDPIPAASGAEEVDRRGSCEAADPIDPAHEEPQGA